MKESSSTKHCFNCFRSESEVPLVLLQYAERQLRICPQCLPMLIHHPEELADKLARAKKKSDD